MDAIKSTTNFILEDLGKKITPLGMDGFKIVEKQNRKFYFTKFSIEASDLVQIYNFIRAIKTETYQEMHSALKYAITSKIVKMNPPLSSLDDKLKALALFSVFYFHYYSTFSYEYNNSFESYYNSELIDLMQEISIDILDVELFGRLVNCFYETMQNCIKKYDYKSIKRLFEYYEPRLVNEKASPFQPITNNSIFSPLSVIMEHLHCPKPQKPEKTKICSSMLSYITSTKEYLVELVYEAKKIHSFTEKGKQTLQDMLKQVVFKNNDLIKMATDNSQCSTPTNNGSSGGQNGNGNFNFNFSEPKKVSNPSLCLDQMQIDEPDENVDTSASDCSTYSKKVFSMMKKNEMDEGYEKKMREISERVNELFLDVLLNRCTKDSTMLSDFICYVVEINTNHIKLIPEYKDFNDDVTMYFVVPARNTYYRVIEVFFSLFDLKIVGIGAYINMFKKKNLLPKHIDCFFNFLKTFKQIISKEPEWQKKITDVFDIFIEEKNKEWMQMLKEREKRMNSCCQS